MNHKNHEENCTDLTVSKDEALFEALGKSKKKKKKKIIRTVISIVLILAILLISAVNFLQRRVRQEFAMGDVEVISYEVTTGTISTVVSGSGTLQNVDTETVVLPSGVELRDILVSYGGAVEEGELIATVDMGTVRSAMSELQTAIEDLDEQIADAEGDQVSAYINAGVSGRVKILYAQKDMEVADVMVDKEEIAMSLCIKLKSHEVVEEIDADSVSKSANSVSKLDVEILLTKIISFINAQGFSCSDCGRMEYMLLELSDCKEGIKSKIKSIAEDKKYRLIVTCGGKRALFEFEIRLKKCKGELHDEKRE